MPVTCKLVSGKHRIVGPDGKIETNKAGTALDGGGHSTRAACMKQAAAINANLHSNSVVGLFHAGSSFVTAGSRKFSDGDVNTQVFKKDMLSVGVYEHPIFGWTMDITEERLHRFVAAFKQMRENGVDIEVPIDHSFSASDNLGYVIDMFIENNNEGIPTLFGMHEIRGADAIGIVERNKNVSVIIDPGFKDGKGNSYGEAIVHSSVVQQPVFPGQGDFKAVGIAASRCVAGKIPVFTLSNITRSDIMDEKTLAKLKELLGAGDDVTADNVLSRLEQRFGEHKTKLSTLETENVELKGKIEKFEADGKKKAASKVEIDPNLAEQMGATAEQQLSLLVDAGKITPSVKEKLCSALIGTPGNRNLMALSIGQKSQPSMLSKVVDALKENDVVKLNEVTGLQVLSRNIPGETDEKVDAENQKAVTDEMVEMVNGPG